VAVGGELGAREERWVRTELSAARRRAGVDEARSRREGRGVSVVVVAVVGAACKGEGARAAGMAAAPGDVVENLRGGLLGLAGLGGLLVAA
jgi:hypothetical protein